MLRQNTLERLFNHMGVASPSEKILLSSSQTVRTCFHFGIEINQEIIKSLYICV